MTSQQMGGKWMYGETPGWERLWSRIFTNWMVSTVSVESDGTTWELVLNSQSQSWAFVSVFILQLTQKRLRYSYPCVGLPLLTTHKLLHHVALDRLILDKRKCLSFFHNKAFVQQLFSLQLVPLSDFNVSLQEDQYSAAVVCQEGDIVLSCFSPCAQKHHHALPSSNRSRLQMGQVEFHYPNNSGWVWSQMETWDCPRLFILLSVALWQWRRAWWFSQSLKTAEPCDSCQATDS